MLRQGTILSVAGNDNAWSADVLGVPSVLKNGVIPKNAASGYVYSVGDGAEITIDFSGKVDISRLRFWIYGPAGRVGIAILDIKAISGDEETEVVSNYTNMPTGKNGFWYDLADSAGGLLAVGAEKLKICFGTMHNNGTLMSEIEVIGEVVSVDSYTVTFLDRNGDVLKSLTDVPAGSDITDDAPSPPEVEGYVFLKWDADLTQITGDVTINPVYVQKGVPVWDCTVWELADFPSYGDSLNLFAQEGATVEANRGTCAAVVETLDDLGVLTDGDGKSATGYALGSNSSLTFVLPYVQDLGDFELYTKWTDGGRDGLEITALEYRSSDQAPWVKLDLDVFSVGLDDNGSACRYHIRAYCPDPTSPIAAGVKEFRVSIGRADNDGVGIAEVRASRFISSQFAWSVAQWDCSADVELPVGCNLLRKPGAELELVQNVPHDSLYSCLGDLSILTNGVLKVDPLLVGAIYPIGNNSKTNAIVDCRFAVAKKISEIRLYTYFTDGKRDGIAVDTLHVQREGEAFFRRVDSVAPFSYGVGNDATPGALVASLAASKGEYLFSRITALRICFGPLDHDCSTFSEIEVFGRNYADGLRIVIR
ncbi:MAG: hypothetical protein ACI4R9_01025 [Kiritimatiellia bacterium]